jgi:hypothetical protein
VAWPDEELGPGLSEIEMGYEAAPSLFRSFRHYCGYYLPASESRFTGYLEGNLY